MHAKEILKSRLKLEINKLYNCGHEIKLTKDFMEWIADGMPPNDARETLYRKMQEDIKKIKNRYLPLKKKLEDMDYLIESR